MPMSMDYDNTEGEQTNDEFIGMETTTRDDQTRIFMNRNPRQTHGCSITDQDKDEERDQSTTCSGTRQNKTNDIPQKSRDCSNECSANVNETGRSQNITRDEVSQGRKKGQDELPQCCTRPQRDPGNESVNVVGAVNGDSSVDRVTQEKSDAPDQYTENKFILVSRKPILNREKIAQSIHEDLRLDSAREHPPLGMTSKNLLIYLPKSRPREMITIVVNRVSINMTFINHECTQSTSTQSFLKQRKCSCQEVLSALKRILELRSIRCSTLKVHNQNVFLKRSGQFLSIDYHYITEVEHMELQLANSESSLTEIVFNSDEEYFVQPKSSTASASSSLSCFVGLRQIWVSVRDRLTALNDDLGRIKVTSNRNNMKQEKSIELSGSSEHDGNLETDGNSSGRETNLKERVPTPKLLEIIAKCLTREDWLKIRDELSYKIPSTLLVQLDDGDIFKELHKRKYINGEKLDSIREIFYNIGRVELVHMIDGWANGDDSYMICMSQLAINERPGANKTEDNTKNIDQYGATGMNRLSEVDESQSQPRGADCSRTQPGNRMSRTRASDVNPSILSNEHREETSDASGTPTMTSHYNMKPKVSCEHYDRFCTIKFACCEEFWACHRCHNSTSKCGQKKLKACDLERIKCNRCGKVQEFPKERPHCIECNLKFSEYFCPICKHLTGTNNKPYHCKDCGICRVNKDSSFHCDICGYCMDLSLKDNHKCRPNSAHDTCFICLEDAFSGCQILPCSHKVHKDCARTMLRRGITRCPVCRESFADKINRRPSCK